MPSKPRSNLPPPLPPEERTVAQFIGETIRAYGNDFWRLLPIGIALALADQGSIRRAASGESVALTSSGATVLRQGVVFLAAAPLFAAAFVWASSVVLKQRPTLRVFLYALLIYLPFPLLRALFIIPGIVWFVLVGLAVPAALVEGLGFRAAVRRGYALAAADFMHAIASLLLLVIVVGFGEQVLSSVLHTQSDDSERAALFLADLIMSPMLFVGGALLYIDQAARVGLVRSPSPPDQVEP